MSDYDFKSLNDKEFEILCADLLSEVEGKRFERFKAGRDAGVDGRFFTTNGKEVILQCKHWANTPTSQLARSLNTIEKPKLDRLNPERYVLAISNPLSRSDKKAIYRALAPHLKSESDIYGKEDLNDLLKNKTNIEQRHYKLWLHSSSVLAHIFNNAILGRSAFSLEEIISTSSRYVVTVNHQNALKILEKYGIIIVTGEPGVGKTTLADHLCLHYVSQGYSYLKISDEIKEAESAFDQKSKQLIYFDDFLGRNYLDALRGHEGSHITQFIRRIIANRNKRFILTSRSTILNQGKLLIDSFDHDNLQRNEFELRIQSLTEFDKAQILYNHIWHSGLTNEYIDCLYYDRRYRKIIAHKNFNPRLISYITDSTRLHGCKPENYWGYIVQSLTNPSQVWENPFVAQQDDFARSIIFLVVLHGAALDEKVLSEAYHRYIALPENQNMKGRQDFSSNIRLLTGSFLNRLVSAKGPSMIDLFNPSIGDYVLRRYKGDLVTLTLGMKSLTTLRSLITLLSLQADEHLSKIEINVVCKTLIEYHVEKDFLEASVAYISELGMLYKSCGGFDNNISEAICLVAKFILNNGQGEATENSFIMIEWALENNIITSSEALEFISGNIDIVESRSEIIALTSLLSTIQMNTLEYKATAQFVDERVIEIVSDCLPDFIEVNSAFRDVQYGDIDRATRELEKLIAYELGELGINFKQNDVDYILRPHDVADWLNSYYENTYDDDSRESESPVMLAIDEIDDLFDRV